MKNIINKIGKFDFFFHFWKRLSNKITKRHTKFQVQIKVFLKLGMKGLSKEFWGVVSIEADYLIVFSNNC